MRTDNVVTSNAGASAHASHNIQFSSHDWHDRWRLTKKFLKMSAFVLLTGRAVLNFSKQ